MKNVIKPIAKVLIKFLSKIISVNIVKLIFRTKIYDCFIFFNELDLLEIRLNELNPYVDYFVLVESNKTFSGNEKPLYYQENAGRYAKFKEKVIHIVVDDMPDINLNNMNRWILEKYQRDQIVKSLQNCHQQDILIVSDADEIPNPRKFTEMILLLNIINTSIVALHQRLSYYYLNGINNSRGLTTICCKYSEFSKRYQLTIRNFRTRKGPHLNMEIIENGGWHFSFIGDIDNIIYKLSSFSHREYDNKKNKNRDTIHQKINQGLDLMDRPNYAVKYEKIDNSYPKYLLKNIDKFRHLIKEV